MTARPWRSRTLPTKEPRKENHERWLISYADFITLLFAFFVVMFATSQVNKKKMERISEVYSSHLRGESPVARPPAGLEALPDEEIGNRIAADIFSAREQIEERLAGAIAEGKVSVSLQPRGLVLSLREASFFDPGEAIFHEDALGLLSEIGHAIKLVHRQPVRLEGHTDDVPIQTEVFPSNWELSAARGIEVMNLLTKKFEIPPERLSVAGYGEHRPAASNRTVKGRAVNRRVDIVILSVSAAAMAPRQRLYAPTSSPVSQPSSSVSPPVSASAPNFMVSAALEELRDDARGAF